MCAYLLFFIFFFSDFVFLSFFYFKAHYPNRSCLSV
jgi:hypothetical protein